MADFQVRAVSKYIMGAPIKMRRVVNSVRGMPAQQALEVLKLLPQAAAEPIYKTVKSALANAEENFALDGEDMVSGLVNSFYSAVTYNKNIFSFGNCI